MEDKQLTCVERTCGNEFTFTVEEQVFYGDNNYAPPKRCPPCRQKRRVAREPKMSKCCNAEMINGGIQCGNCGSDGR